MNNEEIKTFISSKIDESSELELIVIKVHLLIESYLDKILDASCINRSYLGKLNLEFYQKVLIANSLCAKAADDKIWKFILELNKLRNDIAHNFASTKRDCLVNNALDDTSFTTK